MTKRKFLAGAAGALALAGAMFTAAPADAAPATAPKPVQPVGYYAFGSYYFNGTKCIDEDSDDSRGDGRKVWTYNCNGSYNQQWAIAPDGSIHSTNDGRCLSPSATGLGDPAPRLEAWGCNGRAEQQWVFYDDGTIRNRLLGTCIQFGLDQVNKKGVYTFVAQCNNLAPLQGWDAHYLHS
ncbi:ricin-type beta-trefoil lectin domain protein [Amycolatopsis sp. WGS_07]|uniref:ricin-type beta-trefoil lectin domain protein n=1 Tax=Amycolatopsis sp. WGS_07 TaxID=3076764 RepID=UPI00387302E4